jgi:glycosyltransferase involved in cell wall biosynthesis
VEAANGDSEGTPNSVMEASACGLPVVATRHAGIPDVVIHNETGYLVDERDVDAMARHMIALVDAPEQAAAMGAAGRARVERGFSMDVSMRRLLAVLRRAAGQACAEADEVEAPASTAQPVNAQVV